MLNRLLFEHYKSPNNGKQVRRVADGRPLLLVHSEIAGASGIALKVARDSTPKCMADFVEVAELVGPAGVVPDGGEWGFGASMVMADGRLHVAWSGEGGIRITSCSLDDLAGGWEPAATLEGPYWLGDLFLAAQRLHLTYHCVHDRNTESVGIAWWEGGRWQWREVYRGEPMFAPVADVGPGERIHLAWADVAERLRYAALTPDGSDLEILHLGDGKQPTIIVNHGQVIIGYESQYPHIHYRFSDDGEWSNEQWLTWCHDWFMPDLVHTPQLCCDRHGVIWLFFCDNTRRSTFWARWMGKGWSEIYNGPRVFFRPPHFDFNLLPIGRLSVEKEAGGDQIGLLLTCERPVRRVEYRGQEVPELEASSGRKVLFFDMLEVALAENLRLVVNEAGKHPENPLMEAGPEGTFDRDRVFNHGTVLFDEGKYRMWYGAVKNPGLDEDTTIPWWDRIHCGYAESEDGIHWRRVEVAQVEWNGSRDNNIVPYLRHSPVMIRDDAEPDPARRYKGFYFWNSGEMREMAKTGKYGIRYDYREERYPMQLLTSPDGIHLTPHDGEVVFPDGQVKPFSAIPQGVFRDEREPDPQKRYKAYGFMSLNLRRRGTCYLYSPDALHWTAHPEMPLIDPAVRGNPPAVGGPTGQVHDTVCFPYEGYYVALYQDQKDPKHMSIELAVSRDAETFYHVKPGSKVIPLGEPGAWDSESILASMPVISEEEIRLYYGGCASYPVPEEYGFKFGDMNEKCLPGLATLRRDGFTAIELADGQSDGLLETIPFRVEASARRLRVNACCAGGAAIRVEVVDAADGTPLPGFGAGDCRPIAHDAISQGVSWAAGDAVPAGKAAICLRFHFQRGDSSPRLYSFELTE